MRQQAERDARTITEMYARMEAERNELVIQLKAAHARRDQLEKALWQARDYVVIPARRDQGQSGATRTLDLIDAALGVPSESATEEKCARGVEPAMLCSALQPGCPHCEKFRFVAASSVSAGAGQVPADTIKKARALAGEYDRGWRHDTPIPHRWAARAYAVLAALAAVDAQEPR